MKAGGNIYPQDTSLTITALAKLEFIDEIVVDILVEQVAAHAKRFTNKDLCLLLWTLVHSTWTGNRCKDCVRHGY